MRFSFCKNSVFSILFLVFFLLGTICGIILFRAVYSAHPVWIRLYGVLLYNSSSLHHVSRCIFPLIPLFIMVLIGFAKGAYRFVPFLIMLRGCLLSYYLSFSFVCSLDSGYLLIFNFILLPLFYLISRYIWTYTLFDREVL